MLVSGVLQQALAQGMAASPPAGDTASVGTIGASMVWQPPADFVSKAHAVCDKSMTAMSFPECFINQMSAQGAPAGAVAFTRMLYAQSDGQVGIMTAFKDYGTVDAAQVLYPLRANTNYGLLLVNGQPKVLDVDDLKQLDEAGMEQGRMFQETRQKFPKATVWPGDRSGSDPWPRQQTLPAGGMQFVVTYPLLNGCHACGLAGVARFGWQFDAAGKFLGVKYVLTPLPPKIKQPPEPTPARPES